MINEYENKSVFEEWHAVRRAALFGQIYIARNVLLVLLLPLRKESLNINGHQFHQHQQNEQSPLILTQHKKNHDIPDKGQSIHPRMDNIHITQNGVLKLLSNLSIHKATGPDEIPTILLKELAPYPAETFTTFFQASINQGTIPPD